MMTRLGIRQINEALDRALGDLDEAGRDTFLRHAAEQDAAHAAERVRRRATLLIKSKPQVGKSILAARDELMLALYRRAAPGGSFVAWCDGSVRPAAERSRAGIGGILMDENTRVVARLSRAVEAQAAFEAEVAALAAVLQAAIDHGAERICVYTDCAALLRRWQLRCRDSRPAHALKAIREHGDFELRLIPRKHNQPAHALALAASRASPITDADKGCDASPEGREFQ
jgi:ribonuclease HI